MVERFSPEAAEVDAAILADDQAHADEAPDFTVAQFVRHAQRHGTAGIIEAAKELLPRDDLATLRAEVAAMPATKRAKRTPTRKRRTTTELRAAVDELARRGLDSSAVAEALDVSVTRARSLLREATKA